MSISLAKRGDNNKRKRMKVKEQKTFMRNKRGREWEEDPPYSSPIFLWALQMAEKKDSCGNSLSLSFSSLSPHSVFLSSFALSAGLFSFSLQYVMYREGFSFPGVYTPAAGCTCLAYWIYCTVYEYMHITCSHKNMQI